MPVPLIGQLVEQNTFGLSVVPTAFNDAASAGVVGLFSGSTAQAT